MDLVAIQPALKALIANLTGLDAYFDDEPRDALVNPDNGAIALLTLGTPVSIGWDERAQVLVQDPDPGGDIKDEWRGNRKVTLTIKIESYDQTPGRTALWYLEQVRNRLPFQSTRAALEAVRLALVSSGNSVNLPTARDDRQVSIAAMDLVLANRTITLDPVAYPYLEKLGPVIGIFRH